MTPSPHPTPASLDYAVESIPSNFLIRCSDGQIVADEQRPTAESMNQLLMNERERATQLVGGPSAGTTVPRPPVAALKGHTEKASFVPGAPSVPGAPQHAAVAQHRR